MSIIFFFFAFACNAKSFVIPIIAFPCNAKRFAVAIIFFSFFFSTENLDRLTKVACRMFQICYARRVWPNSDTLENGFVNVLLVIIHDHGACDQYLLNLREEIIKTYSKAVYQSSGRVVIESSVYCVNRDYTSKSHL